MSFFGAGLAVGAATAVSKKLSNKKNKEEERFAALSSAFDQGKSEFDLAKGSMSKDMQTLYNRTEQFVVSSGLVTTIDKTDAEGNFEYQGSLDALESMGINVYAGTTNKDGIFIPTLKDNKKVFNNSLDAKTLTHALTKLGLAKLSSASEGNENFNINNGAHFEAILNARIGKNSKFKPSLLRDENDDGKVINTSVLNSGYELGAYADPVAKKIGIGQRISNFFNPADDPELIRRIAQENKISIKDAERLVKAGQTEEQDAFAPSSLEANLGSEFGDLPDVNLQNLFSLIPTDADTLAKVEASALKIIASDNKTVKNLVYQNVNLPDGPDHIKFNDAEKSFKDRNGDIIDNEKIVNILTSYSINQQTEDITTILPKWKSDDKRYIGDANNMTDYFGEIATIFTRVGDGMTELASVENQLQNRGFPKLNQVKSHEKIIDEINSKLLDRGLKYNKTFNAWRFESEIPENRRNLSQHLNAIVEMLKTYSVASEDLIPLAYRVVQEQIGPEYSEQMSGLTDEDAQ